MLLINIVRNTIALALSIALMSCGRTKNSSISSADDKVSELISQMTLEEKLGQMLQVDPGVYSSTIDLEKAIADGKIGSLLNIIGAQKVNRLQKIAIEQSRLHIPLIVGRDVIHGFRTIMPIPLGMAATWDTTIVKRAMEVAATEARAAGVHWTFAPMIDISRDARWGRIAESCGEDTYLTSVMTNAMVKGFQGDEITNHSVAACAKHYVGYGAAEGGRDYNTTNISEYYLRNIYLPPFKTAVDAGALTFMSAFNSLNGVPASGNAHTIRDILKTEWQFDGFVVSDWASVKDMVTHGYCETDADAAQAGINAGVDMEMSSDCYIQNAAKLIKDGKLKMSQIDDAVRRILKVKATLGLFEHPYTNESLAEKNTLTLQNLAVAQQAAEKSAVLLKNDGILPLKNNMKVALIGPLANAAHDQMGTWVFDGNKADSRTLKMALESTPGISVKYAAGLQYSRDEDESGFAEARRTAANADVCVLALGEESILSGEAHCLAKLVLQGHQQQLFETLKATGKPVVVVIMAGRPLAISKIVSKANAVLYAFHPGTMAGPALANLLYGIAIPEGRLPLTFVVDEGQIPLYYNYENTCRPAPENNPTSLKTIPVEAVQYSLGNSSFYLDYGSKPLFPFGYGLSYTTFEYRTLQLSSEKINTNSRLTVKCNITNTGQTRGTETVQLYLRDRVASFIRPIKELRGFQKITLNPGEQKEVAFNISAKDLGFYSPNGAFLVEPGAFDVWIGPNAEEGLKSSFAFE